MRVLLVNTNLMQPPIAPVGLDYLADAVHHAGGFEVLVLDLCFGDVSLGQIVSDFAPDVIGVTVRNTDDCYFAGQDFFIPKVKEITDALSQATEAPLLLGGVGFSVMPEEVLQFCGLRYGLWGEGEFVFPQWALRVTKGESVEDVPGLVFRSDGHYRRNPPQFGDLQSLHLPSRSWLDNARYFQEGGQIGFETKRGCDRSCVFCADPVAKGNQVRPHPPQRVACELKGLLAQGIDHFHTCDSEFNLPEDHALSVCHALAESGIGDRAQWYAYCSPTPFSADLAGAMVRAGCAGIDFGADHSEKNVLARLGRTHQASDLERVAHLCHALRIPFMFDLLLGGPGETVETLHSVLRLMKDLNPTRVGLSVGVRVYPGTPLARLASHEPSALRPRMPQGTGPLNPPNLLRPQFYLSPALGDDLFGIVSDLVADDPRFLFADPTMQAQNYNYNANQVLIDAIAVGHRGAYWDILRRISATEANASSNQTKAS